MLQESSNSEYKIPTANNYPEMYRPMQIGESFLLPELNMPQVERISPASERLYFIARSIEAARKEHLGGIKNAR